MIPKEVVTGVIQDGIVQIARGWLGTPYAACADIKGVGVDCAMLLVRVYHAAGLIPDIDPRPYSPDFHLHRSEEQYLGWLGEYAVEVQAPAPGDVVAFKRGRAYSHAGIVVDDTVFIHALAKVGVIESGIHDPRWCLMEKATGAPLRKFYRLKQLEQT